jgi:hypothetical protein
MQNNIIERCSPKGTAVFRLRDKDGKIKKEWTIHNLIVTTGKALQSGWATGLVTDPISHMAIGTGIVAADPTDVGLGTELDRQVVVATQVTTVVADDTAQFISTFTFAAPAAITEAGLFDDPTAGDMLSRQVFAAVPVVALDSLEVTWKIQY